MKVAVYRQTHTDTDTSAVNEGRLKLSSVRANSPTGLHNR